MQLCNWHTATFTDQAAIPHLNVNRTEKMVDMLRFELAVKRSGWCVFPIIQDSSIECFAMSSNNFQAGYNESRLVLLQQILRMLEECTLLFRTLYQNLQASIEKTSYQRHTKGLQISGVLRPRRRSWCYSDTAWDVSVRLILLAFDPIQQLPEIQLSTEKLAKQKPQTRVRLATTGTNNK